MISLVFSWKSLRKSSLYIVNNIRNQRSRVVRSQSVTCFSQNNENNVFSKPGISRQIFCNIELNGASLEAVGFDMDFTLAQVCVFPLINVIYKSNNLYSSCVQYKESFDLLAFEGAKQKLINSLGYPAEFVSTFYYDSQAYRRGLIIDKKKGNILKVDRHKYVRKAYHGFKTLIPSTERKAMYTKQVTSFSDSNYVNIDTLFHPIDALIFCQLVDLKDEHPDLISKPYEEIYKYVVLLDNIICNDVVTPVVLYRDVRMCVDLCHRDGVIKDTVMKDPGTVNSLL